MKHDEIITIESTQKSTVVRSETLAPSRILVPIDSSGSAFNSLAYTLHLAKVWGAGIHLYYIIDIYEIPDSESSFVIESMIKRLESKAKICLESLREFIQMTGVKVISSDSEMGQVKALLGKKIDALNPELIAAGLSSENKRVLKTLVRQVSCPVLIVPEAVTPKIPSSVLFLNNHEDMSARNFENVMKVIQRTSSTLHILSTSKFKLKDFNHTNGCNLSIQHHDREDFDPIHAVEEFVKDHEVDMVCTLLPKQSFFERLINRCIPLELASRLSIPVLIIRK